MRVAIVNSRGLPRSAFTGSSSGSNGQVLSSGSNGETFWSPFVRSVTADSSNLLLRPDINLASGSNILFSFDRGPIGGGAFPSNTLRIHSTQGTTIFANSSNGQGLIADSSESQGFRFTLQPLVGELLMQDGVSSPPVPLESDPGQDDWLYGDM